MSSLREDAEAELDGKLTGLLDQREQLIRQGCIRLAWACEQEIRETSVLRVRLLMRSRLA